MRGRTCESRFVKSCGPSGSQDLAFQATFCSLDFGDERGYARGHGDVARARSVVALVLAGIPRAPSARVAGRGTGRGCPVTPRRSAAARLRRRGQTAARFARSGCGRARLRASGRRLRGVVPRVFRAAHPGQAEDPAANGGGADLRRDASGRQDRPHRRSVRQGTHLADGDRERSGAHVVSRTHGPRRSPDSRGSHPGSRSDAAGLPPVGGHAQPAACFHEGRFCRPQQVHAWNQEFVASHPRANATRRSPPRSSELCASWRPAGST